MQVKMDAATFKQMINNAKKFTNNVQPIMQYIYLEFAGDQVTATALDGYRITMETAKTLGTPEPFNCYIRPNIPKITSQDTYVTLEMDNNRLLVTVGDNITGYVQPKDIQFYNTEKYIVDVKTDEPAASVWVSPKLLKEALESCNVIGWNNPVKLEISSVKSRPIKIWYGQRDAENNLKLVLPVNYKD